MKEITSKWWFWPLIGGVALRVIVMPITFHPDFIAQTITSYYFSHKGIINIYDYLINLPPSSPLVQNFSIQFLYIYPPLMYFTQGMLNLTARLLTDSNFIPWVIENVASLYQKETLLYHLFMYKLPYLGVDIVAAFSLSKVFSELRDKKIVFSLWMFNPLAIYTTFMVGQNDLLPVLFTILSLAFFKKRQLIAGMIMIGIAGSLKMYPLLFILPAAFLVEKKLLARIRLTVVGFIPYILTVGPFIFSKGFRQLVLLNPESRKILFMHLPVSGAESVYIFVLVLIFIYLVTYYDPAKGSLNSYFLILMLLLFSVTHYHPQWFIWATPFLAVYLTDNNFKHSGLALLLLISWLGITFMFEPSLNYALFAPINPEFAKGVGLSFFVQKFYDANLIKSLIRSVFAGSSLYLMISILRQNKQSAKIN